LSDCCFGIENGRRRGAGGMKRNGDRERRRREGKQKSSSLGRDRFQGWCDLKKEERKSEREERDRENNGHATKRTKLSMLQGKKEKKEVM